MSNELTDLRQRLAELSDLNAINALLGWDQGSIMPAGAGDPDTLAESVRSEAKRVLDDWTARAPGGLKYVDRRPEVGALMASADSVDGDRLPTPSSLRDVDSECTLYVS